jgi:hypothetical protein
MKKLLLSALIGLTALAGTAHADPHNRYGYAGGYYGYPGGYNHHRGTGYGYNGYHSHGDDWIAPAIIGGVIGYAINQASQPRVVYTQQPQVVYQTPYCTPWTETVDQYGTVTRTRTCTQ